MACLEAVAAGRRIGVPGTPSGRFADPLAPIRWHGAVATVPRAYACA
jgi:hypothetical protein